MKIKLLLAVSFLFTEILFSQADWDPELDYANFAFLIADYNSYNFEGGYFTKLQYHPGFDNEDIPFTIEYNSPNDYGNILFKYTATGDTVFAADIWWAGMGEITFPDSIENPSSFTFDPSSQVHPVSNSYINYFGELSDSVFKQKADSAWESIKNISAVSQFNDAGNNFRVGKYLYTPALGVFRPEAAKWIIFLYNGESTVGIDYASEINGSFRLMQNYPNPFNPATTIEFIIPESQNVRIALYNIVGEEKQILLNRYLKKGRHKLEFDGTKYSSGVYLYSLKAGRYSETKKLVLIK